MSLLSAAIEFSERLIEVTVFENSGNYLYSYFNSLGTSI